MGNNQVKERVKEEDETARPILMDSFNEHGQEKVEDIHTLAYYGHLEKIKELLQQDDFSGESIVRKLDNQQMTPVHNAARGGGRSKTEVVKLLLKHDEDDVRSKGMDPLINLKDLNGKTALHYAVLARRPDLVGMLINDFNADVNIMDDNGFSPFLICVSQGFSEDAVTCTEIFLNSSRLNRNQVSGPQSYMQTPVHLAASAMADKVLKCLVNNGFKYASVDGRCLTPLHLAVSAGDEPEAVACVIELLRVYDAEEVNARSSETGKTALHLAAENCHYNVLKTLLKDDRTDIWVRDKDKRTALHWATESWSRSQSLPCVKLLAESDKVSDWQDKARFLYGENDGDSRGKEETAMDIALHHKSLQVAEYLIQAHPSPEAWLDDVTLNKIYSTLPEAMLPLMNNTGITYNPTLFHARNESVDAEFGMLTGYQDPVEENIRPETKYLHHILSAPKEIQQSMLLHPLVQIFIDLKWKKIRPFTWLAILFSFVWLALYTVLVWEMYVPDCTAEYSKENGNPEGVEEGKEKKAKSLKFWHSILLSSKESSNIMNCEFNNGAAAALATMLFIMNFFIIMKELFQFRSHPRKYFKMPTNWAQIALLILSFISGYPAFFNGHDIQTWQIYLASLGIFIGWMLSLREIAKFPNCGIYSAILKKVFLHCFKMLTFYIPILLAFSFSLRLLLPGKGQYNYVLFAIVKVVIMMTGELDFEESFYEEDGPKLALNFILAQFAFLLLVFMTTIVLLNLLTGLAVNDVQSLIEEAEINRLSNELEQIYLLESLLLAIRGKIGKERFLGFFHRLNVTSFSTPDYNYFNSKKAEIETRSYSPNLKSRIRSCMVPLQGD